MDEQELIEKLREQRDAVWEQAEAVLAKALAEDRKSLNEAEQKEYDGHKASAEEIDARVQDLIAAKARRDEAAAAVAKMSRGGPGIEIVREPLTYEKWNRRTSYFRDLGLAFVGNDQEARARLARHSREVQVELPKLVSDRFNDLRAKAGFDRAAARKELRGLSAIAGDPFDPYEQRALTRTDGAGGEFVPPIWLMEDFAEFARAGRVTADRCRPIPLPGGTDSINIPRITGGTTTAAQTDGGAVSSTDATTGSAAGPVNTVAGQQDMALQLLEQSPVVFDEIIFADLIADYNKKLDTYVINGSGAAGQHTGLLVLAGTNAVTYTDATPTVGELYPKGADAVQQIATQRFLPPSAHVFHPRRWFWMTAALDSQGRPLVVPIAQIPMNAMASEEAVVAEGPVGTWHGLPVYMDANVPVNLGAGTNEDAIMSARFFDILLFEGILRTRTLSEVLSGTLQVRLQVYSYSAFIPGRQPKAISKINGTGLITPTF